MIIFTAFFIFASVSADVFVPVHMCGEGAPCGNEKLPETAKTVARDPLKPQEKTRSKNPIRHIARDERAAVSKTDSNESGNLPKYFEKDRVTAQQFDQVVMNVKSKDPKLKALKTGDIVHAVIDQAMVCSPTVATPIRAISISGPVKGSMFIGEARLDHELKRVLLNFTKLRLKGNDQGYKVAASGLSLAGSVGLEGEYVSNTGKFFVAEIASAFTAGLVDASVDRTQTQLGTYNQSPSLENRLKVGAATALMRTADRAGEQAKTAPEFTKVEGYQEIQILIHEDPTEGDS